MLAISLEQLVDQFEEAWQNGERPDIDAFLPTDDDRLPALVELVHIDLERRAKSGEDVHVESYLQRFAELNERPIISELLAAEFQHRSRRDPNVTYSEFIDRFPQLRDEITGFTIPAPSANGDQLPATWTVAGEASGPPGQRVGPIVTRSNYSTLQLHARGGLGEVFIAHDEVLNRDVALKSLQAKRVRDGVSRSRFLREAEITGRLEHPGVVPVYGLGQDAAGNPVYAMRFIRGQTFQQAIDQYHASTPRLDAGSRRLAFQQLLRSFLSVCNTIAYAHSRGIIHRDVKPGNILLGEYGETLVVDWGLARETGVRRPETAGNRSSSAASSLPAPVSSLSNPGDTMAGDVIGTPAFMSPEQARGQVEEVGPASDIYSLGATLYVLLTGRPPFAPQTLVEVLREVQRGAFIPPRQVNRRISRGLEAVCLKAMALQPHQRYASALELARDLEHWLAGEPVGAWREPPAVTARRWLSRHATLATGSAVAIVAAAVLVAVTAVLLAEKRVVDLRNEQVQKELARADQESYLHRIAQAGREWLKGQRDSAQHYLNECRPELRQFEWHHLQRCLQSGPQALTGHTKEVWAVAFSRDGKRLASASLDGTVRIWDALTGEHLLTLTGHAGPVWGVDFHPDGTRLATCSDDGTVRVWDSATGKELSSIEMQVEVLGVAFSPDGKRLAACTVPGRSANRAFAPGRATVFELATGKELFTLLGHASGIHSVAFSPDGERLVTAGIDGLVKVWDLSTRKTVSICRGHRREVFKAVFSPDGQTIASASYDGAVILWNAETGKSKHVLLGHQNSVWGVAFSPDGKRVASSCDDMTIRMWDVEHGRLLFTLRGHTRGIANVVFSPDGEQLASASDDQTVRLWKTANPGASFALIEHADKVNCVAVSPNGDLAASVSDDRTLRLWDLSSRRELACLRVEDLLTCVTFHPRGKFLVYSGMDGVAHLWNIERRQENRSWTGHEAAVKCVAFSPDGQWLATASNDNTVKIWHAASGRLERTLSGHTGHVTHVAFSPNGRRIATASADKTVKLWDAASGNLLHDLTGYTSAVLCVAFSPDSGIIATSTEKTARVVTGEHGQIKLLNAETAEELGTLQGHFGSVTCVAFTNDGKRLISGSDDGTLKIWDRATGQELLTLHGHTSGVRSLAIHPANRLIVSGGLDGNVILWYGHP